MKVPYLVQKYLLALIMILTCMLLVTSCTGSSKSAMPFEQALSSGKPTIAEFGRGICIPCKAMKPILEELAVEYRYKLNVVIVEVDEQMDLTRQYGIMAIPTQIVFDSGGREITRHIGFWSKEEIIAELKTIGIE